MDAGVVKLIPSFPEFFEKKAAAILERLFVLFGALRALAL